MFAVHPLGQKFGLVPTAVNKCRELALVAGRMGATHLGGALYKATYSDPDSFETVSARIVNLDNGSCQCMEYQAYGCPCKDALAAYQLQGKSWQEVLQVDGLPLDPCDALKADLFKSVSIFSVDAPDMETLLAQKNVEEYATLLKQRLLADGLPEVVAPPVRNTESHGSSKRKRKVKSTGAGTKARTATRSYVAVMYLVLFAKRICTWV